jgi:hypothetical protein
MPDHFRQQLSDPMAAPRSPNSSESDHPLSLVIGKRGIISDHIHRSQQQQISPSVKRVSSAPPSRQPTQPDGTKSPSSSSGFASDDRHSNLNLNLTSSAEDEAASRNEDEEAPLALVVDKKREAASTDMTTDSGHSEEEEQRSFEVVRGRSRPFSTPDVVLERKVNNNSCSDINAVIDEDQRRVVIEPNVTIAKVTVNKGDVQQQLQQKKEEEEEEEEANANANANVNANANAYANANAGIKIKDFARLVAVDTNAGGEMDAPTSLPPHRKPSTNSLRIDVEDRRRTGGGQVEDSQSIDVEDMSDEVTSVSSIDTWTSSMISDQLLQYSLGSGLGNSLGNGVTIRRVSKAANGDIVYPCDFCDRCVVDIFVS